MARKNYRGTIFKLQTAINTKGEMLTIQTQQFYSLQKDCCVTQYTVMKAVPNIDNPRRTTNVKLYSSYSQINIIMYLRDYWYELNGWELPVDNIAWCEERKKLQSNSTQKDVD